MFFSAPSSRAQPSQRARAASPVRACSGRSKPASRGTTSLKLVRAVRAAGAKEVHLRSASPPIVNPDFYGIDMATRDQLIASHATVEKIREHIGATSLGYLSTDGLSKAMALSNENFCLACFTGTYPIEIPDAVRAGKDAFEPTPRR